MAKTKATTNTTPRRLLGQFEAALDDHPAAVDIRVVGGQNEPALRAALMERGTGVTVRVVDTESGLQTAYRVPTRNRAAIEAALASVPGVRGTVSPVTPAEFEKAEAAELAAIRKATA
jgi:hypothetical protein